MVSTTKNGVAAAADVSTSAGEREKPRPEDVVPVESDLRWPSATETGGGSRWDRLSTLCAGFGEGSRAGHCGNFLRPHGKLGADWANKARNDSSLKLAVHGGGDIVLNEMNDHTNWSKLCLTPLYVFQ